MSSADFKAAITLLKQNTGLPGEMVKSMEEYFSGIQMPDPTSANQFLEQLLKPYKESVPQADFERFQKIVEPFIQGIEGLLEFTSDPGKEERGVNPLPDGVTPKIPPNAPTVTLGGGVTIVRDYSKLNKSYRGPRAYVITEIESVQTKKWYVKGGAVNFTLRAGQSAQGPWDESPLCSFPLSKGQTSPDLSFGPNENPARCWLLIVTALGLASDFDASPFVTNL